MTVNMTPNRILQVGLGPPYHPNAIVVFNVQIQVIWQHINQMFIQGTRTGGVLSVKQFAKTSVQCGSTSEISTCTSLFTSAHLEIVVLDFNRGFMEMMSSHLYGGTWTKSTSYQVP